MGLVRANRKASSASSFPRRVGPARIHRSETAESRATPGTIGAMTHLRGTGVSDGVPGPAGLPDGQKVTSRELGGQSSQFRIFSEEV